MVRPAASSAKPASNIESMPETSGIAAVVPFVATKPQAPAIAADSPESHALSGRQRRSGSERPGFADVSEALAFAEAKRRHRAEQAAKAAGCAPTNQVRPQDKEGAPANLLARLAAALRAIVQVLAAGGRKP